MQNKDNNKQVSLIGSALLILVCSFLLIHLLAWGASLFDIELSQGIDFILICIMLALSGEVNVWYTL